MTPTRTQGRRTYPPSRGALQEVETGGIPWVTVETPPAEEAMDVHGRPIPAHVAHGGDPPAFGMEIPGPDSKKEH